MQRRCSGTMSLQWLSLVSGTRERGHQCSSTLYEWLGGIAASGPVNGFRGATIRSFGRSAWRLCGAKIRPLKRADLDEFISCYHPANRHERKATWSEASPQGRWRPYGYAQLSQRDKLSPDIFWLKDDSLEDTANLEEPDVIAAEIVEDLRAALEEFELILGDLSS
jgi:hypothetical protein